jgi:hypothetical protein
MTMIAMPATMDNSADQTRSNPPMALALAPSATNTVAKPSTNRHAANNVSRRTRGGASLSASRSREVPAI